MIPLGFLPELPRALGRFPLAGVTAATAAAVAIASNHDWKLDEPLESRLLALCALLWPWFVAVRFAAEHRGWGRRTEWLAAFAGAAAIALHVWSGPRPGAPQLFLGGALALLTLVAATSWRPADGPRAWAFAHDWVLALVVGALAAALFSGGLSATVGLADYLFAMDVGYRIYSDILIVGVAIFGSLVALFLAPSTAVALPALAPIKAVRLLIVWVAIPLVVTYGAVLTTYAASIAIAMELPKGRVAWLTAPWGCVAVAVWLAAWPLERSDLRHVRFYVRWLGAGLVVPTTLLAVAIAERIAAYGITESRYALVMVAVWLALFVLGFTGNAARWPLVLVPSVLGALLLLGTAGPLSGESLTLRSQLARLERYLAEAGVPAGGTRAEAARGPEPRLEREIAAVVRVFAERDRLAMIRHLSPVAVTLNPRGIARDAAVRIVVEGWGLTYRHPSPLYETVLSLTTVFGGLRQRAVAVTGFQDAYEISCARSDRMIAGEASSAVVTRDRDARRVVVRFDDGERAVFDLEPLLAALGSQRTRSLSEEESRAAVLDAATPTRRVRLVIRSASATPSRLEGCDATLLIARRS